MFLNVKTVEAKPGKVKINDIQGDTKELLLYFLCNDEIEDTKMINAKLLVAADKYNILGLLEVCSYYLKQNISVENGIDILIKRSCLIVVASDFIISILIKTI